MTASPLTREYHRNTGGGGVEEWEDLLEFAKDAVDAKVAMPKDAPAKIKEAYNNYYAQKNKKKSSTRDKVVAKVKKSRSK